MEVAGCFLMLVPIYTSVCYHIPEDQSLNTDSCQNLKFHILAPSYTVCDPISDILLSRTFWKPAVFQHKYITVSTK